MMSIRADTHLFGSKQGYRTLAHSAGVVHAESDELSVFGFGQTGSSAYLDRLATEPSAYGRQLQSGRVGITRCLKGFPDDAGRPTLFLCTLLIAPQDYEGLVQRGLESVINDSGIWELGCFESGEQIPIRPTTTDPPRSVQENDLGVLDAWLTSQLNRGSVSAFSHERKIAETVLALPQVLDANDRLRYRWGVNLLSGDAPVDVCTLSRSAKQSGRRKVNRFDPGGPIRNDIVEFLRDRLDAGTLRELPSLASMLNPVPESSALLHEPLVLNQATDIQMPFRPSHKRRVMTAAALSFAGVAVVASVLVVGAGIFRKYQDAREEYTAQIDGTVAMDTSSRGQSKPEEPVEVTRRKPKPPPEDIGPVDPLPAPPQSSTKDEDRPRIGDTETPPPAKFTFDVGDTPQDQRTRSMLDDSANEGEDDDTSGPIESDPDPAFKDKSVDQLATWFVENPLPKPDKSSGTQPFNDQYGKDHLRPYVAALKEMRTKWVYLELSQWLDPTANDVKTDLRNLRVTIESEAELIRKIMDEYIEHLVKTFGQRARAPSIDSKKWKSKSALEERLNLNESLTEDAEICVSCKSVMRYFARKYLTGIPDYMEIVDGWSESLGSKNKNKSLLGKLRGNKELLENRIERLRREQPKLSIELGSDNAKSDH